MINPNELRKQSAAFHHESETSKTLVLAADTIERLTADRDAYKLDAGRYKTAIALDDNAEILYAAVLNNAGDLAAIGLEFDAAIAKEKTT